MLTRCIIPTKCILEPEGGRWKKKAREGVRDREEKKREREAEGQRGVPSIILVIGVAVIVDNGGSKKLKTLVARVSNVRRIMSERLM